MRPIHTVSPVSGQIGMPPDMVGREVVFADGARSEIYRETAMRDVGTSPGDAGRAPSSSADSVEQGRARPLQCRVSV
jgi:hypothetical protein